MTVFFTSDHHLGHRAMAWKRRYGEWPEDKSLVTPELVADHDDMLAQHWDQTVSTADVVWVLGDLTANSKHVPEALTWFEQRPGTKHLVLGNHDPAHPMHRDAYKWQRAYFRAFESVQMAAKRTVPLGPGRHQLVLLSHFPYTGDGIGREDRCNQWRLPSQGYAVLHGHTHSPEKVTIAEKVGDWAPAKQIHVGVDAWDFTPVPLEQIGELLA
jgi:calcineurin-like phosphoesterase family protein